MIILRSVAVPAGLPQLTVRQAMAKNVQLLKQNILVVLA